MGLVAASIAGPTPDRGRTGLEAPTGRAVVMSDTSEGAGAGAACGGAAAKSTAGDLLVQGADAEAGAEAPSGMIHAGTGACTTNPDFALGAAAVKGRHESSGNAFFAAGGGNSPGGNGPGGKGCGDRSCSSVGPVPESCGPAQLPPKNAGSRGGGANPALGGTMEGPANIPG